jgi:ParB family chromosome partitioning protein
VILDVEKIIIPTRLRPVDPLHVVVIAASIAECGLLNPVTVRVGIDGTYVLVAGAHRLEAVRKLKQATIEASIVECDEDGAKLTEIDENLARRELGALDRAIFLAERKKIYLRMFPEAAPGRARKKQAGQHGRLSFARDVERRTGLSERTTNRAIELCATLAPEAIELLRLSPIADNSAQLKALAKLPADQQVEVARAIFAKGLKTIRAGRADAGLIPRRKTDRDDVGYRKFLGLWLRGSKKLRAEMIRYVREQDEYRALVAKASKGGR